MAARMMREFQIYILDETPHNSKQSNAFEINNLNSKFQYIIYGL
jgi:hypothetical protein